LVESGRLRISRKPTGKSVQLLWPALDIADASVHGLLRNKRPEHLKDHDPAAFGRVLGLDRAGSEDIAAAVGSAGGPPSSATAGGGTCKSPRQSCIGFCMLMGMCAPWGWVDYILHDQAMRFLTGKLRLRQVV
jgi:hypothetical protein